MPYLMRLALPYQANEAGGSYGGTVPDSIQTALRLLAKSEFVNESLAIFRPPLDGLGLENR